MCTLEKRGNLFLLTLTGGGEHRLSSALLDEILAAIRRVKDEAPLSPCSVFITKAEGKFFSNGFDTALLKSDPSLFQIMHAKLRAVILDLISLPMPTIAAVTGHACAAGFILAMSHDYLLMRRDRGFLYLSELNIGFRVPAWSTTLIELKIGSPAVRRELLLKAAKLTAAEAEEKGIVDSSYGTAEETVEAAVKLGEELVRRGWDGNVYGEIRGTVLRDVLDLLRFDDQTVLPVLGRVRTGGSKL